MGSNVFATQLARLYLLPYGLDCICHPVGSIVFATLCARLYLLPYGLDCICYPMGSIVFATLWARLYLLPCGLDCICYPVGSLPISPRYSAHLLVSHLHFIIVPIVIKCHFVSINIIIVVVIFMYGRYIKVLEYIIIFCYIQQYPQCTLANIRS